MDAGADDEPLATRREWLGLAVIALPCLLYAIDLTVLVLALPRISADLQPSSATLLWIVDIYGFFVAGLLVTMGTLGDRIGRRRVLFLGAAAFGAASVAAAYARSAGMLIAARAVLGVAGATLAPSTLSLIRNMFRNPRQRTLAIGVWISSYSIGSASGPLLGGVILQHFRWGTVFLLAVPVMALLLIVGPIVLPEARDPSPRRLDLPSAALSLLAVLSAIYGLKIAVQDGFGGLPAASFAAAVVFGGGFVRRQTRLADPLIDLRLFRAPAFATFLGAYLLATLTAFGSYILIEQYLQLVLGLSPLVSGLWTLPWSLGFAVGSLMTPTLARRVSPGLLMGGGLVVAAVGFAAIPHLTAFGAPGIAVASAMFSVGLAPVVTLGTDFIIGAAPPEQAGAAAAISETSSELGGALGIAVLGSVATAVYRAGMAKAALAELPPEARKAAVDTLGGAAAVAARLSSRDGARLLEAARGAFTEGLHVSVTISAAVCALTAVGAVLALRRARPRG